MPWTWDHASRVFISSVIVPSCTVAPCWLMTSSRSFTTPRPGLRLRRVPTQVTRAWIVSPAFTGPEKSQCRLSSASAAPGLEFFGIQAHRILPCALLRCAIGAGI